MRRAAGKRHHGPRGRALGRFHGQPRSDRAARRRQGTLRRQGRVEGGGAHQHRDQRIGAGAGRLGAGLPRQDPDRPRRHRQQGPPGRQCHAGGEHGGGARGGRGIGPAAVPLLRRHGPHEPAGADDERHQRRRACQQQPRPAGVHDHPGRRAEFPRSGALRRRGLPRAEEDPPRQGNAHQRGRRRRLRAERGEPRSGDPDDPGSDREGRLQTRRADRPRPGLRRERIPQGRQIPPRRRRPGADGPGVDRHPGHLVRQVPHHQHRRRHGRV